MSGSSPVEVVTTVWDRIKRALMVNSKAAQESHVLVGVIAKKGGNEPHAPGSPISMIELAAIHEFGATIDVGARSRLSDRKQLPARTIKIPQRSSIRSTFKRPDVTRDMGELCGKLVTKVIQGMKLERALGLLGAWGVSQIRETINTRQTTGPDRQANAPSTIAAKGSDLPLVNTGRLINAITWLVKMGFNRDEKGRFTGGKVSF
jgi:hypothetical protein